MTHEEVQHYAIVGWEKFQHYKASSPAWIKMYVALLDKPHYRRLPDVSKAQLHGLMLLAARCRNEIPNDPEQVALMIGSHDPLFFDTLVSAGFIRPCIILNNPEGPCGNRSLELEVEIEKEKERSKPLSRLARDRVVGSGGGEGTTTEEEAPDEERASFTLTDPGTDEDRGTGDGGGSDDDSAPATRSGRARAPRAGSRGDESAAVRAVLAGCERVTGRTFKLTDGRDRKIRARLREGYTVEQLVQAMANAHADPFFAGQNDRGRRYDRPETVFKTAEAVEGHLEYTPKTVSVGSEYDHLG